MAKKFFRAMALVFVAPIVLFYGLSLLILPKQRAFADAAQVMSLFPGISGEYLRLAFYRVVLARCGLNSCIGFGTIFSHPTIEIGSGVYVGPYCIVGDVVLEDDVLLASGVSIANGVNQHYTDRLDVPIREQGGEFPRITIGTDSWIGERAIVLANVGRHCVVGAGALVLEDVPDYAVVVGVPAKVVKFRNQIP
ncbi:MAG: acyltransferase [Planctomycetia bacterium]|nr:acyltransferase [Planctomycetia bacterium]